MKKWLIIAVLTVVSVVGIWWYFNGRQMADPKGLAQLADEGILRRYDFDSLKSRGGVSSEIKTVGLPDDVNKRRKSQVGFDSKVFVFESEGKHISGLLNVPLTPMSNKMPAVIMIRGYADKAGYYPGFGSWRMADELAKIGYVTASIDFLGFGLSDGESLDMLEARFEKVVGVLDLIASVRKLDYVDPGRISIWAHSNGGQIALSVLEVTGENYPTVMWAPMTNPFPQSVLDTASDLDDGGKAVVAAIEEFQKKYDSRRYAFENYYHWIKAPVLIIQGTADEWCKVEWQQAVINKLTNNGQKARLVTYEGDDHNLTRSWKEAVTETITFFAGE